MKREKYQIFLNKIKGKIVEFKKENLGSSLSADEYVTLYSCTRELRDEFLYLIQYVTYIKDGYKLIASTLEDICIELKDRYGLESEVIKTLLHEVFIYVIAIYLKNKNYAALSYTLTKTYFIFKNSYDDTQSFNAFYENNQNMDNSVSTKDGKKKLSGTASYWVDNINTEICNINEIVFADVFCYNAAVFMENYIGGWYWFPIMYIYNRNEYSSLLRRFAIQLKSKEHLQEAIMIFGYSDINKFKEKFVEVENNLKEGKFKDYRYSGSFESAPLICQFVKSDELGTHN